MQCLRYIGKAPPAFDHVWTSRCIPCLVALAFLTGAGAGAGPRGQCRLAACPGDRIFRSRIRGLSRILRSPALPICAPH
jgi:hypothetical protein